MPIISEAATADSLFSGCPGPSPFVRFLRTSPSYTKKAARLSGRFCAFVQLTWWHTPSMTSWSWRVMTGFSATLPVPRANRARVFLPPFSLLQKRLEIPRAMEEAENFNPSLYGAVHDEILPLERK
jgi:hypothetical protein